MQIRKVKCAGENQFDAKLPGCNRERECKGLCRAHYQYQQTRKRRERVSDQREAPPSVSPQPRWTFENDEGERELMERVERQGEETRT